MASITPLQQAPADIVRAAAELVPALRARTAETDRIGKLPDETIAALETARLFELTTPSRYGGVQASIRTYMDAMIELGRGDVAVSWVATIINISNWFAATLFPPQISE